MSFSDIDECSGGSSSCHADATCQNQIGSYECICNQGIFLFDVFDETQSIHTVCFKRFPCS